MNRAFKRVLSLTMALLLAMSLAVPVLAAGKVTPMKGTQTVYMPSKDFDGTYSVRIQLATGTKNFNIKRSDVKVTAGTAGAKLSRFEKNSNRSAFTDEYLSASGKWRTAKNSYTNCDYSAFLQVEKTGTAKVSYKIGGKTYKINVKVLPYKNPVKSITIKGVNGGKSFASATKDTLYDSPSLTVNAVTKGARMNVTPAKGWKVSYASITDDRTGHSRSVSSGKGLSTASLYWGTLDPSHLHFVTVEFVNASNGATLRTTYRFGQPGPTVDKKA